MDEPSPGSGTSSDGKRRWGVLGGLVLLAAALLAYILFLRPPEVDTVQLGTRDIQRTLVVAGRVRAPLRAELGASVPGVVRRVAVQEADSVEEGQVVVQLDDDEARAAVQEAEARLAEIEAVVEAEIERTEVELAQARRDLERVRAVRAEGGLTDQRVEQAEQRVSDAAARLAAARAEVGASSANARVAAARAALSAARARLANTTVRAPYDGTVLQRFVEPGDAVQPGRALLEVASEAPIEIVAFPSEDNLGQLQVGASAVVSADAYPEETFPARVSLIAPAVDASQGTVEVRLTTDQPPPYLRPGMTLSVNIVTGRRQGAEVLPAEAVRGLGTDDPWVPVVVDGRVERRPVEIGLRGERFVQVLSGLDADTPVVDASADVSEGDRVRVRAPGVNGG